jgi:hypothetical protein
MKACMSKAKKLLVVAGAVILGLSLVVFGIKDYRTSKKLQAEGKQTVGVVTDASVHRGRKGRRSYYLTVLFKTEAQTAFEQRKSVSRSDFEDASKAGSIQVTYLASDPSVCAFGPKVTASVSPIVFGVLALGFAGFLVFGKTEETSTAPTSEADVEKQLVADNSKYDDQKKAA